MAIQVDIEFSKTFPSSKSLSDTFLYFSDVEKAIKPNFPGLLHFENVASETYRWVFEAVKYSGYEIQVRFTTRIEKQPDTQILLHPVPKKGESELSGGWHFSAAGSSAEVRFQTKLKLELPIPFFLKAVAQPVTQKELSKIFDRYVENVGRILSA